MGGRSVTLANSGEYCIACIYVSMYQSNESEKSRSFQSATNGFDYEKHPQHLILAVSDFPFSISNDAI